MKILLAGATGFIGTQLIKALCELDHHVRVLSRTESTIKHLSALPHEVFQWQPEHRQIDASAVDGIDAVINLAGEPIAAGRWTSQKKERIRASRINGNRLLIDSIEQTGATPVHYISASAVGIYGNRGEEPLDEKSAVGKGFLADVCKDWEAAVLNSRIPDMRKSVIRFGMVLGKNGGALARMVPVFRSGLGGALGNGKQFMSWIHHQDVVGQLLFLLQHKTAEGIYNGVAPNPVRNAEFVKTLAKQLSKPCRLDVPAVILKLRFGEMAQVLLDSQRVLPTRFLSDGYEFAFPTLETALGSIF